MLTTDLTNHLCAEPTQHGRFLVQDQKCDFSYSSMNDHGTRDHGRKVIAFSQSSMHDSSSRHEIDQPRIILQDSNSDNNQANFRESIKQHLGDPSSYLGISQDLPSSSSRFQDSVSAHTMTKILPYNLNQVQNALDHQPKMQEASIYLKKQKSSSSSNGTVTAANNNNNINNNQREQQIKEHNPVAGSVDDPKKQNLLKSSNLSDQKMVETDSSYGALYKHSYGSGPALTGRFISEETGRSDENVNFTSTLSTKSVPIIAHHSNFEEVAKMQMQQQTNSDQGVHAAHSQPSSGTQQNFAGLNAISPLTPSDTTSQDEKLMQQKMSATQPPPNAIKKHCSQVGGNPGVAQGIQVIHEEKLEEDVEGDDEASDSQSHQKQSRWTQNRRQNSMLDEIRSQTTKQGLVEADQQSGNSLVLREREPQTDVDDQYSLQGRIIQLKPVEAEDEQADEDDNGNGNLEMEEEQSKEDDFDDDNGKNDDVDDEKYNASINSDGKGDDLAEEDHERSYRNSPDRREKTTIDEKQDQSLKRGMLYQSSVETLHLPGVFQYNSSNVENNNNKCQAPPLSVGVEIDAKNNENSQKQPLITERFSVGQFHQINSVHVPVVETEQSPDNALTVSYTQQQSQPRSMARFEDDRIRRKASALTSSQSELTSRDQSILENGEEYSCASDDGGSYNDYQDKDYDSEAASRDNKVGGGHDFSSSSSIVSSQMKIQSLGREKEHLSALLGGETAKEGAKILLIRRKKGHQGIEKARFFNLSEFKLVEIDSSSSKLLALLIHRKTKKQIIVRVTKADKASGQNFITCKELSSLDKALQKTTKESTPRHSTAQLWQSMAKEKKGRFTTTYVKDLNASASQMFLQSNQDDEEDIGLVSQKSQPSENWDHQSQSQTSGQQFLDSSATSNSTGKHAKRHKQDRNKKTIKPSLKVSQPQKHVGTRTPDFFYQQTPQLVIPTPGHQIRDHLYSGHHPQEQARFQSHPEVAYHQQPPSQQSRHDYNTYRLQHNPYHPYLVQQYHQEAPLQQQQQPCHCCIIPQQQQQHGFGLYQTQHHQSHHHQIDHHPVSQHNQIAIMQRQQESMQTLFCKFSHEMTQMQKQIHKDNRKLIKQQAQLLGQLASTSGSKDTKGKQQQQQQRRLMAPKEHQYEMSARESSSSSSDNSAASDNNKRIESSFEQQFNRERGGAKKEKKRSNLTKRSSHRDFLQ